MICCSSSSIAILSTASRIDGTVSRTRTRSSLPLLSHSFHFQVNVNGNHQLFIRRRISRWCRVSPNVSSSLELPLLPFNTNEVLVPSESKTLHLYEARYLALLEESLLRKKLFVHFVLDPILISNSGTEASFAARYGCLVNIENIERLDVGALVSIRGIGRVKLLNFVQSEPYLKGEVIPLQDRFIGANEISSKVIAVKDALRSLNSLEIKLKAPKEELLQTCIANSLTWAEKEPSLECDQSFIPSPAERISFAAFQPITSKCFIALLFLTLKKKVPSQKLQYFVVQQKLRAMDLKDTLQRLDNSLDLVNENISMVAAKLAIQSLEMQRATDMGFVSTFSAFLNHHNRYHYYDHQKATSPPPPQPPQQPPSLPFKVFSFSFSGLELSIVEGDDSINAYLLNAVKNNNGTGTLLLSDIFGFEDSSTRDFAYRVACNGYKHDIGLEPQGVRKDIDASTKWMVDEFLAAGISKKHGVILWYKDGPALASKHKVPMLFVSGDNDPLLQLVSWKILRRERCKLASDDDKGKIFRRYMFDVANDFLVLLIWQAAALI
ncbi:hypothetical protein D5086_024807 [Populus alba]|uniref:Uncharacterized protein n=1 Tax=Populus alba TaxID=43335 RepID=A0ACC4B841_POPAL